MTRLTLLQLIAEYLLQILCVSLTFLLPVEKEPNDLNTPAAVGQGEASADDDTATNNASLPKKNILFIGFDDLRPELRCYGATHMHTPNMDALAKSGMLFRRAYCQQAICAASRSSLLTGLRPDSTGIYDLNHPMRETLPQVQSMPRFFKEHGYRTVSLGKIYHHPQDDKEYWDVLDSCSAPAYASTSNREIVEQKKSNIADRNLTKKQARAAAKGPAWEMADVPDETYGDGKMTDEAIRQLQNGTKQPFFMAIGFRKPHLPFVAPQKYWDLYNRSDIQIPSRESPVGAPPAAFTNWGELRTYHAMPATGDLNDEQTRELIHGYRACVSYVDEQLGRILKELDRLHLRDNTLIVLWGDHGWKLGEYGDWCKHTNWELDTHVPLILSGPNIPADSKCNALVEYIDLFPTLAQFNGLQPPQSCEGHSLLPLLNDPTAKWDYPAISQYPRNGGMGYTVRYGHWRYTEWRDKQGKLDAAELYDHRESSIAQFNVIDEQEHQETVEQLKQFLKDRKPKQAAKQVAEATE